MSDRFEVRLLNADATMPTRGSNRSAGFDLYATGRAIVAPGAHALIGTGIAVSLPEGFYGRVAPRSGLAVKKGINIHAGVVDNDYRGEIHVCLINHGDQFWEINAGDRIAQLVLERYYTGEAIQVDSLGETERGAGGFGSTGT